MSIVYYLGLYSMVKHMRKTRKANSLDYSSRIIGECCDSTFNGLSHWYKHLFEELGWMILAKNHGMTDKINVYISSLKRFKMTVEQKLAKMRDADKKDDLIIMHHNITILMEHAMKDL